MARNLCKRDGVWYFQAKIAGKRYWESLQTGDEREAVKRARVKRDLAVRAQFDQAAALALDQTRVRPSWAKVGEVCDAYLSIARALGRPRSERTRQGNVAALLRVVEIGHGATSPREASLGVVVGALADRYLRAKLKEANAQDDGVVEATCRRSVCSTLAQARSVLLASLVGRYRECGLRVPDGVEEFRARWVSESPEVEWTMPGEDELKALVAAGEAAQDAQVSAAWCLAYHVGLRASEVAACRRSWFERGPDGQWWCVVRDRPEEGFLCKGSRGQAPVRAEIMARLDALPIGIDGRWIRGASPNARTQWVVREFAAWMRVQGWARRECAHELRKVRVELWRRAYGLVVASTWARHSSARVTAEHYADAAAQRVVSLPAIA